MWSAAQQVPLLPEGAVPERLRPKQSQFLTARHGAESGTCLHIISLGLYIKLSHGLTVTLFEESDENLFHHSLLIMQIILAFRMSNTTN